jgi:transketolase
VCGINAPIPISDAQLDDLRRIILKTVNKDQVLILSNIPRVPTSITSVLRNISRRYNVPLSTLRRNSQILKGMNLITYGEASDFSGVELTELGRFITELTAGEEPSLLGTMVQTVSGLRPLGTVLKGLRQRVLRMVAEAGSGHLGASLSVIDILAVLYFVKMRHDPSNPEWEERDRLVLSKGHAAPALYAVLAEAGYFPQEELVSLRRLGGLLQGHPEIQIPGVDASTGSLGQGLSIAVGMALAAKMDEAPHKVYTIIGDGELDEGQIWEAALTAGHHGLDNLVAIVDRNQFQLTGRTEEIKAIEPVGEKWKSFGWEVVEADGNDPPSILDALDVCDLTGGKPSAIIAHTTKGKGVSFMEGNKFSKSIPDASELARALAELA